MYRAVVLSVLLYGAETWSIKANHVKKLQSFHNRCIRMILGVTRYQQWKERITFKQLASASGMEETIEDTLMLHGLRWLGHLGRMETDRIPKMLLFGEQEKKRPNHWTKKRDGVRSDLQAIGVGETVQHNRKKGARKHAEPEQAKSSKKARVNAGALLSVSSRLAGENR